MLYSIYDHLYEHLYEDRYEHLYEDRYEHLYEHLYEHQGSLERLRLQGVRTGDRLKWS